MPSFNRKRLRELADARGDTTLEAISQRTGLDISQISRLLRGERQPNLDTLAKAADAYEVTADELILREIAA